MKKLPKALESLVDTHSAPCHTLLKSVTKGPLMTHLMTNDHMTMRFAKFIQPSNDGRAGKGTYLFFFNYTFSKGKTL
jgi:hypothetical protein